MERKPIGPDNEGIIMDPEVHDDNIWMVEINGNCVTLGFYAWWTEPPENIKIHFDKIDCLLCSPFLRGNICFEIELADFPDSPEGWQKFGNPRQLIDQFLFYYGHRKPKRYAFVSTSYGAEMLLAGDFEDSDITWENVPLPAAEVRSTS